MARPIEVWLNHELRSWFSGRLLDIVGDIFAVWRRLVEKGKAMRYTLPRPDLFIAATAVLHDLCVVTRNTGLTGVSVLNPWTDIESRPPE